MKLCELYAENKAVFDSVEKVILNSNIVKSETAYKTKDLIERDKRLRDKTKIPVQLSFDVFLNNRAWIDIIMNYGKYEVMNCQLKEERLSNISGLASGYIPSKMILEIQLENNVRLV